MRTQVIDEVIINRPLEQVFDFATTAKNWPQWHPNTLTTAGANDHSAMPGEQIVEFLKVLALPVGAFRWTVTERVAPSRWQIETQAPGGLAKLVITYTFTENGNGSTTWKRDLVYETNKTPLTLLANLFVEPYMRQMSMIAVKRFKAVLEGASP